MSTKEAANKLRAALCEVNKNLILLRKEGYNVRITTGSGVDHKPLFYVSEVSKTTKEVL